MHINVSKFTSNQLIQSNLSVPAVFFPSLFRYDNVDEDWKASDVYEALLKEETETETLPTLPIPSEAALSCDPTEKCHDFLGLESSYSCSVFIPQNPMKISPILMGLTSQSRFRSKMGRCTVRRSKEKAWHLKSRSCWAVRRATIHGSL